MTRDEEIKKLIATAKQKARANDNEFTDDEVVNLPFYCSYEYGFASGAMWQKKQIINWLKQNAGHYADTTTDDCPVFYTDALINDLQKFLEQ